MSNKKDFAVSIILLCVIFCCKKEKSFEREAPARTDNHWEFVQSDTLYQGPTDTAEYLATDSGVILTITGPNEAGNGGIILTIATPTAIIPDIYGGQNIDFKYVDAGVFKFNHSQAQSGPFTVTITSVDSSSVSGVFSGDGLDVSGNIVNAREGKFVAPLKQSALVHDTDPPAWEGDWFPLRERWTYSDLTGGDTLAITSSETKHFGGFDYTVFRNNVTLEQRAYRKSKSKYYELVTYFEDAPLSQPVDLLFLQDDLPAGTSWETGSSRPLIRGYAYNAKIRNTIVNKGHQQSFNGRTYYNLIEVKTEILLKSDDDAEYQRFGKASTTIYAKGVGVVFYEDDIFQKSREILNYSVLP